jgi:hypothetical protein
VPSRSELARRGTTRLVSSASSQVRCTYAHGEHELRTPEENVDQSTKETSAEEDTAAADGAADSAPESSVEAETSPKLLAEKRRSKASLSGPGPSEAGIPPRTGHVRAHSQPVLSAPEKPADAPERLASDAKLPEPTPEPVPKAPDGTNGVMPADVDHAILKAALWMVVQEGKGEEETKLDVKTLEGIHSSVAAAEMDAFNNALMHLRYLAVQDPSSFLWHVQALSSRPLYRAALAGIALPVLKGESRMEPKMTTPLTIPVSGGRPPTARPPHRSPIESFPSGPPRGFSTGPPLPPPPVSNGSYPTGLPPRWWGPGAPDPTSFGYVPGTEQRPGLSEPVMGTWYPPIPNTGFPPAPDHTVFPGAPYPSAYNSVGFPLPEAGASDAPLWNPEAHSTFAPTPISAPQPSSSMRSIFSPLPVDSAVDSSSVRHPAVSKAKDVHEEGLDDVAHRALASLNLGDEIPVPTTSSHHEHPTYALSAASPPFVVDDSGVQSSFAHSSGARLELGQDRHPVLGSSGILSSIWGNDLGGFGMTQPTSDAQS